MTDNATEKPMRRRQVPAVTRAISILRQLGRASSPVGVNQLARELDLIPSTCLHILRALVEGGLVAFDPTTKRYTIDVGILPLARNAIQRNTFAALAERSLTGLSERFGVTGIATQISDPRYMVVVALSQAPLPFRLQVDMGSQFPVLISATGRCYAAFTEIPEPDIRQQFDALAWENPPPFDQWLESVRLTRERGYAVDHNDYIAGVTIVAVPVFDKPGRMRSSFVAIGITEKVEAVGIETLGKALLDARDEVNSLLVTGPSEHDNHRESSRRRK